METQTHRIMPRVDVFFEEGDGYVERTLERGILPRVGDWIHLEMGDPVYWGDYQVDKVVWQYSEVSNEWQIACYVGDFEPDYPERQPPED